MVLNVVCYDVFKLNEVMFVGDVVWFVWMIDGLKGEGEVIVFVMWVVVEELCMLLWIKCGMMVGKLFVMLLCENCVWGLCEWLIVFVLNCVLEVVFEKVFVFVVKFDW